MEKYFIIIIAKETNDQIYRKEGLIEKGVRKEILR